MKTLLPLNGQQALAGLERIVVEALIRADANALTVMMPVLTDTTDAEAWRDLLQCAVAIYQGRYRTTADALDRLRHCQSRLVAGLAHVLTGYTCTCSGQAGDAAHWHRLAVEILPTDASWALGLSHLNLSYGCLYLLQHTAAWTHAETAMQYYRRAGTPLGIAQAYTLLATLVIQSGDIGQGLAFLSQSEQHYAAAQLTPAISFYRTKAQVLIRTGRLAEARQIVDDGIAALRPNQSDVSIIVLRCLQAEIAAWSGDRAAAQSQAADIESWAKAASDQDILVRAVWLQVLLQRWQGRARTAYHRLVESEAGFPAQGSTTRDTERQLLQAHLAIDIGRRDVAAAILNDLVERLSADTAHWHWICTQACLARLHRGHDSQAAYQAETVYRQICQAAGYALAHVEYRDPQGDRETTMHCQWFGKLRITMPDGSPLIQRGRGDKALALVAMLTLTPAGLPVTTVASRLFPESRDAIHALHVMLGRLRRRCAAFPAGSPVEQIDGHCRLNAAWQINSDLDAFDAVWLQLLSAGTPAVREAASRELLDFYAGPLFGDHSQASWAAIRHHATRSAWQQAHTILQEAAIAREDWTGAFQLNDANLKLAPWDGEPHRLRLHLLIRQGSHQAALSYWQSLCQMHQEHPETVEAAFLRDVAGTLDLPSPGSALS